jgi:hypothetical protein
MLSPMPAKPYKVWIDLKLRRFGVISKMARWAGTRSNSGLASGS